MLRRLRLGFMGLGQGGALGLPCLVALPRPLPRRIADVERQQRQHEDRGDQGTAAGRLVRYRPQRRKPYSAAAVVGRPTKPATSPKRSTMTAGKSFAFCVTQAPERTA